MEREKIPNRGWKQLNQIGLSCLFLSHITILILMRLPVFPTCFFFSLRWFEHKKNLKKRKFQELRITVWPGATQQTPTMTDSLFKARGSCFHQGILVGFFLQFDTTSPCHLPFSKITTSRWAFCLCVVLRWASQPRPSVTQAFPAMLLAGCCLQPSLAVWCNVKYSLLNCQARTAWEPSQALTVQQHWILLFFKHNQTKSITLFAAKPKIRSRYLPPPATRLLPDSLGLQGPLYSAFSFIYK